MHPRILSVFSLLLFCSHVCGAVNLGDSFFDGGSAPLGAPSAGPSKDRVIVLANGDDPDSLSLARYYCEKRQIPFSNIVILPLSREETVTREDFTSTLLNPLLSELISRGWISAEPTAQKDPEGRLLPKVNGHKIDFLVVMRGVPLGISRDDYLLKIDDQKPEKANFHVNEACVDSELACMLMGRYPLTGFVPNPLFNKKNPTAADRQKVVRVARLDGPKSEHVKSMIDGALEAERSGLRGRAYFDLGGPHPKGDEWISKVSQLIDNQGYGITIDRSKALLGPGNRWDAPAIYLGWYADSPQGPFAQRGFRFAPGAIAWHIHSFSARSMRNPARSWVAMFAQQGVAATLGNVYEPYLELTHMPEIYFPALLSGATHGEAVYGSLPVLSWMNVAVGDPLYRPFSMPLSKQLELARSWQDRSYYAQYAIIRVMNLLDGRGKKEEALLLGQQSFRKSPGLALALDIGTRLWEKDKREAMTYFAYFEKMPSFSSDNTSVARAAAIFLADARDSKAATALFAKLIDSPATPVFVVKAILPKAVSTARTATMWPDANRWHQKLLELSPPPPPAPAATPTKP